MELFLNAGIRNRAVVYNGDFENTNSDIQIINFKNYNSWIKSIFQQ